MKFKFIDSLNLESEVSNRLSSSLEGVVLGSSEPVLSPLAKSKDPEQILFAWDEIFNANLHLISDDLYNLEMSNRSKYGPRSLAASWRDRREDVNAYFESSSDYKTVPNVTTGSRRQNLRPISLISAMGFLKNSTNSGLPYFTRKGPLKDIYLADFNELLARCDSCALFTRTQEGGKTRTVWGYPMADTLNEMRFYRPLLEYQKKLSWRSALCGPDKVDESITRIINDAVLKRQSLVSIDFSAYDASVKYYLQKCSFDYIKSLYQSNVHVELDYIAHRFNTIGLVTPDGIKDGDHGVPSGSTFTNEVDSIVQYLCATHIGLTEGGFDIQGDDGAYRTVKPEDLMNGFKDFGLKVNGDKSLISDKSLVYLQNLHSTDYTDESGKFGGIYSCYRALNRILFPERFDAFSVDGLLGADYYSIKTISILENCRNHPLFKDFVKFIANLDRFGLRYSQQGLAKYIERIKLKSGVEGIFKYRRGDELTGIQSFSTVKILSEL